MLRINEPVAAVLRGLRDDQLYSLATTLAAQVAPDMADSRAQALLRAMNVADETLLSDFESRMLDSKRMRVALYDLLDSAEMDPPTQLTSSDSLTTAGWLRLAVGAYAHKVGFPVSELDPANPPTQFSPAGQVIHRASDWARRQVQRSATERDKIARKLAYDGSTTALAATASTAAPEPARGNVPVTHFEFNDDVSISADDVVSNTDVTAAPSVSQPAAAQSGSLRITDDDLEQPIDITLGESRTVPRVAGANSADGQNLRQALAENLPELRDAAIATASALGNAVRAQFRSETLTPIRLRVEVYDKPNGARLPSVQVTISCKGVKGNIAGTTNNNGVFAVELPVRAKEGLTYHADVTWPLSLGGQTERKSVTLSQNRTEFLLTFYRNLS